MTKHFYIGVDGGATKTRIRVEDDAGFLLGQAVAGPANIRLSIQQAWASIHLAIDTVLQANGLSEKQHYLHVGMGIAGCEMQDAYHAFVSTTHPFTTLVVSSDAHVACLGAHGGQDGAIIIAGTGVVGFQIEGQQKTKVSGWGFPHDDEGGGAWLGLQAVKVTLQWLDGRLPASGLAQAVYARFAKQQDQLVQWANQANSTAFAELAPLVIQQSQANDAAALSILQQAAQAIDKVGLALATAQILPHISLPCALIGGVASALEPFLTAKLRARLHPCQAPPDAGALFLIRHYLDKQKD